jgi:hypothetical protein
MMLLGEALRRTSFEGSSDDCGRGEGEVRDSDADPQAEERGKVR